MSDSHEQLDSRVREWLEHEGYPLEFQTAKKFREAGFDVLQGKYFKDPDSESPREIDVLAQVSSRSKKLFRVCHVVECKWSKDKPWVVFTGNRGIAPAACVAQTIASTLGSAILWKEAGVKQLQALELFSVPARSGFNGRQALSKDGSDRLYNAFRSVVSATKNIVDEYDNPNRKPKHIPQNAVVGFPVIVVQGELYEAFLESVSADLQLKRIPHVRCHWRGAKEWPFHATVDIVTFDQLDSFLSTRHAQVATLLQIMQNSLEEISWCVENNSFESLNITKGSRGVVGLHRLFREFVKVRKAIE